VKRVGTRYLGLRIPNELFDALSAYAAAESAASGQAENLSEVARNALATGLGIMHSPEDAGYQAGKRLGYAEAADKISAAMREVPDHPDVRRSQKPR
jgi:hypothetical protein